MQTWIYHAKKCNPNCLHGPYNYRTSPFEAWSRCMTSLIKFQHARSHQVLTSPLSALNSNPAYGRHWPPILLCVLILRGIKPQAKEAQHRTLWLCTVDPTPSTHSVVLHSPVQALFMPGLSSYGCTALVFYSTTGLSWNIQAYQFHAHSQGSVENKWAKSLRCKRGTKIPHTRISPGLRKAKQPVSITLQQQMQLLITLLCTTNQKHLLTFITKYTYYTSSPVQHNSLIH